VAYATIGYGFSMVSEDRITRYGSASIVAPLERAARETPGGPCVRFAGGPALTYAELLAEVRAVAGGLRAAGLGPGDRVALLLGNRREFLTTYLGLAWLGAVSVPLNTALRGDVLTYMLDTVGPCALVVEDDLLVDTADAIRSSGAVTQTWVVGECAATPGDLAQAVRPYAELYESEPASTPHPTAPSDLLSILFTSGTTGPSKGVMWSHRTALAFAANSTWVMGYTGDDVIYTCLPLFHINALFTAFLPGLIEVAPVVISRRFSASRYWTELIESRATVTNMLGAMGAVLWKQPPSPAEREHRLRLAMVVPFPSGHHEEFEARFGIRINELYGSTDTAIPIGVPHGTRRPGSCGRVAPGWTVDLVDENDEPVPPGMPGELVTRPTVPFVGQLGYWRLPDKTWEAHRNSWFHTGDQLVQDEEGWFYFRDRLKDALRVSGENVSAFEVEHVLTSHPSVAEAAVYAVPSELGEDAVMASVVPEPSHTLEPAALIADVTSRLAYFAVPRYVDVVTELPKTSTQKVRKAVLRERGVSAATWDGGPRRRSAAR
jgi:crotonobetaine/carnitine-CoA ligase